MELNSKLQGFAQPEERAEREPSPDAALSRLRPAPGDADGAHQRALLHGVPTDLDALNLWYPAACKEVQKRTQFSFSLWHPLHVQ